MRRLANFRVRLAWGLSGRAGCVEKMLLDWGWDWILAHDLRVKNLLKVEQMV